MKYKAIDTAYAGRLFRSRTEARWAVLFDQLGIKWEYELEGYELSDGTRYLPDFWLPEFNQKSGGTFVEVKPVALTPGEMHKAVMLNADTGHPVLLAVGTPENRVYDVVWGEMGDGSSKDPTHPGCFQYKYLSEGRNGDEYRMFWYPGFEDKDGRISADDSDEVVVAAFLAAQESRFEFGQSGPKKKAHRTPWRARL